MLAVDVGNTITAIGLFENKRLRKTWKIRTDQIRTSDEYRLILNQLLAMEDESLDSQSSMIVASVVPSISEEFHRLSSDIHLHIVSHRTPISFSIEIPDPSSLGADRIADLEAAVQKYPTPILVIDAGTATTISILNHQKEFIGGMIAPGLRISSEALFQHAARLHQTDLEPPLHSIGRTTEEAVASGLIYGHAAMIDGLMDRALKEINFEPVSIIATGGSIEMLAPHFEHSVQMDRTLTLDGLSLLHQKVMEL